VTRNVCGEFPRHVSGHAASDRAPGRDALPHPHVGAANLAVKVAGNQVVPSIEGRPSHGRHPEDRTTIGKLSTTLGRPRDMSPYLDCQLAQPIEIHGHANERILKVVHPTESRYIRVYMSRSEVEALRTACDQALNR
jgi:hypothetical protein